MVSKGVFGKNSKKGLRREEEVKSLANEISRRVLKISGILDIPYFTRKVM